MTIHVGFDDARNLITVASTGAANQNERLEALRNLRLDSSFRSDYQILCRFFDDRYAPGRAECIHLGLTLSAFFRGQQIALVVGNHELAPLREGVAMFNTERVEINVFNDVIAATRWLLSQREAMAA